jgi:cellulose synthase/poly-beta-1,6-N-acetylglucosamine synthase-like glycosyltransferase
MKVTLICTVLNEAASVPPFLAGIRGLKRQPDEIVVCDAGSTDGTRERLEEFAASWHGRMVVLTAPGNRSAGRNAAIRAASHDVIACTDMGCRLTADWLGELVRPFERPDVDVVAGLYRASARTFFEQCAGIVTLATYGIRDEAFIPSARSMAFRRAAWEAVGGFPEQLDFAEDTAFGLSLRHRGFRFAVARHAIVDWRPRSSMAAVFRQLHSYAVGDAKARIAIAKMARLHARYLLWLSCMALGVWGVAYAWVALAATAAPYWTVWALAGAAKAGSLRGIVVVPAVKLVADVAWMMGYWRGVWGR